GLKIESRYFANVLTTKEAAAMIRSLFVSMRELNKLARRPAGVAEHPVRRLGIVGAGFMGAGIAHAAARTGIEVALLDRDQPSADKGKETVASVSAKDVSRGRMSEAERGELLQRIEPTTDFGALA